MRASANKCWQCGNFTAAPMMVVIGPWAGGWKRAERMFCSMDCFWKWTEAMREERSEGGGIDGQERKPAAPYPSVISDC